MSLIACTNLTFSYPGSHDEVFHDLSLRLDSNWRLGLVGRNGRGKTTLLRLLAGEYDCTGRISASVPMRYFPLHVPDEALTAHELAAMQCPDAPAWIISRELSLLGLDEALLSRPLSTLSGGERTKVLLALLFSDEHSFPLIDEPTNHLDLEGRRLVSAWLAKKEGFLLVSHDRAFLDGCVDHILALNRSDVTLSQGSYTTYAQNKARQDAFEVAENQKLKREIDRLRETAGRTATWSDKVEASKYGSRNSGLRPDRGYLGHKAAKLMKRAKAAQSRTLEAAEEASQLRKNIEREEPLKLRPLAHHAARLVEARGFSPDYGGGPIFPPLDFSLATGERLAVTGGNGRGKSSLLRLVAGEAVPHAGTLTLASGLVVSYLPQDPSFLAGSVSDFAEASQVDETLLRTILRKLGFARIQFEKDMADYSAGQKKKTLLARSLCQSAHLYVWDEPLNYIDLHSRLQIEALLRETRPTMLLVEHDDAFLDAVCTRRLAL